MRKAIGFAMLALLFVCLFIFIASLVGFLPAIGIFVVAFLVAAFVMVAGHLIYP